MANKISEKAIVDVSKKKKRETWTHSIRKGDLSKTMEVEELDGGGYLVTVRLEGPNKKGEWEYTTKKLYSETNPLDIEQPEDPLTKMANLLVRANK